MAHALLAPSSMDRIISCFASLAESDGKTDKGSRHAHEGTAAHSVHSWALEKALPAMTWLGEDVDVEEDDEIVATFECDEEMVANVQISLDLIYGYMELDPLAELYVEQRVDFSHITGHPSSFGTSDVIIIMPTLRMIYVVDFKYGKGVKVDAWDWHAEGATPNAQMASYGLGALKLFEHYKFDKITLVIHQPRIGHVSDYTMDVRDLEMWGPQHNGTRHAPRRVGARSIATW